MKKLFYGLGAIAAVATPIVAVVSCGSNEGKTAGVVSFDEKTKTFTVDMDAYVNKVREHFGNGSDDEIKAKMNAMSDDEWAKISSGILSDVFNYINNHLNVEITVVPHFSDTKDLRPEDMREQKITATNVLTAQEFIDQLHFIK